MLQENPEDASALSLMGVAHAENRDYPQAIAYLDKALRISPTARGHFNLASLYRMQGDDQNATSSLREALKLDPGYARAIQMLSEMGAVDKQEEPPVPAEAVEPEQTAQTSVSQFENLPQPAVQTPPYGTSSPGLPQGQYGTPPSQFRPATRTQTVMVRHWPKIILGGLMIGIPYLLMSLSWGSALSNVTGFGFGFIIGLVVMGIFFKWLSNSAGAFETQHWILMILLTGLLPSLLVIKGFDILAAGWYHTERRSF